MGIEKLNGVRFDPNNLCRTETSYNSIRKTGGERPLHYFRRHEPGELCDCGMLRLELVDDGLGMDEDPAISRGETDATDG